MNICEKNIEILNLLYNNAIDLIEKRDLTGAVNVLELALELGGDNPQYLDILGLCCYSMGSFAQARSYWMRNTELNNLNANSEKYLKSMFSEEFNKYVQEFNLCIESIENGKHAKALLKILPLLEFLPNVQGYNLAGMLFYRAGMKKSALRLWKKSLCIDISDKTAAYYIANCKGGLIPLIFEKILLEVLLFVGKLKLL